MKNYNNFVSNILTKIIKEHGDIEIFKWSFEREIMLLDEKKKEEWMNEVIIRGNIEMVRYVCENKEYSKEIGYKGKNLGSVLIRDRDYYYDYDNDSNHENAIKKLQYLKERYGKIIYMECDIEYLESWYWNYKKKRLLEWLYDGNGHEENNHWWHR